MKKAIDRLFAILLAIIAITVGFSLIGELIRPYVGLIVIALVVVISLLTAALVLPVSAAYGTRAWTRIKEGKHPWAGD